MQSPFPKPIALLPKAEIPLEGASARLSQGKDHQILFMQFKNDVDLPAHQHAAQWGIVLEGTIELTINGKQARYSKGDRYFIPADTLHSGKIFAGYADITYFDQPDRFQVMETE